MLTGIQALWNGDLETSMASALQAAELAARFGDADLQVLSGLARGQILIAVEHAEGMSCLDEVMVAVTAGEVSPDGRRTRLLRGDRGLPGDLRSASGAGVDEPR